MDGRWEGRGGREEEGRRGGGEGEKREGGDRGEEMRSRRGEGMKREETRGGEESERKGRFRCEKWEGGEEREGRRGKGRCGEEGYTLYAHTPPSTCTHKHRWPMCRDIPLAPTPCICTHTSHHPHMHTMVFIN